jgi:hypothetical protein
MNENDIAEMAAKAMVGVDCHIASAIGLPPPTDWMSLPAQTRDESLRACAEYIASPARDGETIDELREDVRRAVARYIGVSLRDV